MFLIQLHIHSVEIVSYPKNISNNFQITLKLLNLWIQEVFILFLTVNKWESFEELDWFSFESWNSDITSHDSFVFSFGRGQKLKY